MRVAVLALDGVLGSALAVSLDVLSAANRLGARLSPRVVRASGAVRTSAGQRVQGDVLGGRADVVVVPGLDAPDPVALDARLDRPDARRAADWLNKQHRRGATIAASCTSTFLLGSAGLLDGVHATTSWYLAPHFKERFPLAHLREEQMVVGDQRIVTAGAALAHVDLMLHLVRQLAGPTIADRCARFLVIDDRTSQTRYLAIGHLGSRNDEVRAAERFVRAHIAEPIAVSDVARAARASLRTLARRFGESLGMTPLQFIRRVRAERAVHLLQTTKSSVEEIATRVGYTDAVALRRLLRDEMGRSAREIRRG
jgi:transcriptional regulator GlxA family with amidase domain